MSNPRWLCGFKLTRTTVSWRPKPARSHTGEIGPICRWTWASGVAIWFRERRNRQKRLGQSCCSSLRDVGIIMKKRNISRHLSPNYYVHRSILYTIKMSWRHETNGSGGEEKRRGAETQRRRGGRVSLMKTEQALRLGVLASLR